MKAGVPAPFGAQLKTLREASGFTQEELATIAGLSVHAVSALERGERRRPHLETVRALSAALDLKPAMRDALVASARPTRQPAAADELSAGSLPQPLTSLLGRERDLAQLRQWLGDPALRLITLIGPGGVGKTRLALELARALAEEGSMRVAFVALAAIRDPGLAVCAVAKALGLADVSTVDLPNRVRAACSGQPTLLVLDNFEQVLDAAPVVADFLTSATTLRTLITSRAALRVRGEREYVLGPLALEAAADPTAVPDLTRSPALRLLVERVTDVQPDFRVSVENGQTLRAICRRLDALPLALELAAPWIKVLPVEELLRRLEHDILATAAAPRDLPERQHTMNATVAWSYQLLEPHERHVFRRLGVLPSRFPIEAAAAVVAGRTPSITSDDVLGVIAALIDKSLLLRAETATPARPLYQMLETVRAYAALELTAAGERDDALEGLVRYCTTEAAAAAGGLTGPAQVRWLHRVRDDLESHRSVLTWLLEHGRAADAAVITSALVFFWLMRGHAAEGAWWFDQVLSVPSLPPEIESNALAGSALMSYMQGELERSRATIARGLALAQELDNTRLIASGETMLGHIEHASGNLAAARDRFGRGVAAYRTLAMPWGVGTALSGLAGAWLADGNAEEAERLLDEAASILEDAGPWFLLPGRCFRAVLALQRGNADEAIALMRHSLADIRELHDEYAFVYALLPLAAAATMKGDDLLAARLLGARDAVAERMGVTVAVAMIHNLRERIQRATLARLDPTRWGRAYAAGRKTSIDSLLKDLDAHAAAPPPRRERPAPVR
jgi:predicted ATPase/DNA-binding XRE family transcriptional regulator